MICQWHLLCAAIERMYEFTKEQERLHRRLSWRDWRLLLWKHWTLRRLASHEGLGEYCF